MHTSGSAAHAATGLATVQHRFFTRQDGVSGGVYASRNCGPGSADDPAHIRQNRARCARDMGVRPERLLTCAQVHGVRVVHVTEPWPDPWTTAHMPEADAMVTQTRGLALGVLTADCAPVLLWDRQAGVIGAAHAGWKGTVGGVLEATLAAMESLGGWRERIQAHIGPCIGQASYQVGEDVRAAVTAALPATGMCFAPDPREAGRYRFDLSGCVRLRLNQAGVSQVNVVAHDTFLMESEYFSFRRKTLRGEPDYGRQLSAIMLAE